MAKFISADEDYSSFHSRFSIVEDLVESEFHIPQPLAEGSVCTGCGAPAEISKFITFRKSRVIDSTPTVERVASEYSTFAVPFCSKCMTPRTKAKKDWTGLYILGFILAIIVGSLFLFQISMNMPNVGIFGTAGPGIVALFAILGWPGIVTLTAFILSRRDQKKKAAMYAASTRYRTHIVDHIDRMMKDGWQYVIDDESLYEFSLLPEKLREMYAAFHKYHGTYYVHSMTEKDYMKLLCILEPGICTLFRGEIGIPQDIITDFDIYDIKGLETDEISTATTGDESCVMCGSRTDHKDEVLLYREVLVGDQGTIKGLAREFGTVELPWCARCKRVERRRNDVPFGLFSWIKFIIMMLPMFGIMALIWIGLNALQDSDIFYHDSDFWVTFLMVIGGLVVALIFIVLAIGSIILTSNLWDYIENRWLSRKHQKIISALEEPHKHGWHELPFPGYRMDGFSPRLEEWLKSHSSSDMGNFMLG